MCYFYMSTYVGQGTPIELVNKQKSKCERADQIRKILLTNLGGHHQLVQSPVQQMTEEGLSLQGLTV